MPVLDQLKCYVRDEQIHELMESLFKCELAEGVAWTTFLSGRSLQTNRRGLTVEEVFGLLSTLYYHYLEGSCSGDRMHPSEKPPIV